MTHCAHIFVQRGNFRFHTIRFRISRPSKGQETLRGTESTIQSVVRVGDFAQHFFIRSVRAIFPHAGISARGHEIRTYVDDSCAAR